MAEQSFPLDNFKKNFLLAATISIKSRNSTIKLYDTQKNYFTKESGDADDLFLHEIVVLDTDLTPKLKITSPGSVVLQCFSNCEPILKRDGSKAGYVYNFFIKDGSTSDGKGIYVNLAGWAAIEGREETAV